MKKIIFSLFLFCISPIFFAQSYQWAINFGSSFSYTLSIASDLSGNVYTTGAFIGTNVDFDPGLGVTSLTSNGANPDFFIAKYNSSGQFVWAFNIGGTNVEEGRAITCDNSGNIYVTGIMDGVSIDFDPGVGSLILNSNGGRDAFLAKYNSSGQLQWAFNIGGTGTDYGFAINIDLSGTIILAGTFQATGVDFDPGTGTSLLSSAGFQDFFLAKYSSSGQYLWAFKVGGTSPDYAYAVSADATGNIFVTGYFESASADFDPGVGTFNLGCLGAGGDIYVAKYDAAGQFLWAFRIGATSAYESALSIAMDASNNFYITGEMSATTDFDPGPGIANLNSNGGGDGFVAKYDNNGLYQWAFRFGSNGADNGNNLQVDNSNNVIVTGEFRGTNVDFDPGTNVANLNSAGISDVFLASYNQNGLYNWAFSIGGTGNEIGQSASLYNSSIYLTGSLASANVDFDPGTGTAVFSNTSSSDIFIAKYNSSLVGTETLFSEKDLLLYPDPSNGKFTIESEGDLEIYSVIGEKILSQKLTADKTEIDLSNHAKGIYFVKVIAEGKMYSQKIIIQ